MVSSGKGDIGAAKLTSEVLQVVEKLPTVIEGLTGVNILKVGYPDRSAKLTVSEQGPHCTGKTRKMALNGKHRDFFKFCQNTGNFECLS